VSQSRFADAGSARQAVARALPTIEAALADPEVSAEAARGGR